MFLGLNMVKNKRELYASLAIGIVLTLIILGAAYVQFAEGDDGPNFHDQVLLGEDELKAMGYGVGFERQDHELEGDEGAIASHFCRSVDNSSGPGPILLIEATQFETGDDSMDSYRTLRRAILASGEDWIEVNSCPGLIISLADDWSIKAYYVYDNYLVMIYLESLTEGSDFDESTVDQFVEISKLQFEKMKDNIYS